MDEIVRQAMNKWPSVPHCYGWLALDARGAFRMRDDAAQTAHAAGDVIRHAALLAFIHRNYLHDERGAWYFQNGPQRVFVELETTPFIARTDPVHGFVFHDGQPLYEITQAWITEEGRLILKSGDKIAMLDDRDMAQCIPLLRRNNQLIDDTVLLDILEGTQEDLQLFTGDRSIPLQLIHTSEIEKKLGFVAHPAALPTA